VLDIMVNLIYLKSVELVNGFGYLGILFMICGVLVVIGILK